MGGSKDGSKPNAVAEPVKSESLGLLQETLQLEAQLLSMQFSEPNGCQIIGRENS